jgi:hypothetical protein
MNLQPVDLVTRSDSRQHSPPSWSFFCFGPSKADHAHADCIVDAAHYMHCHIVQLCAMFFISRILSRYNSSLNATQCTMAHLVTKDNLSLSLSIMCLQPGPWQKYVRVPFVLLIRLGRSPSLRCLPFLHNLLSSYKLPNECNSSRTRAKWDR